MDLVREGRGRKLVRRDRCRYRRVYNIRPAVSEAARCDWAIGSQGCGRAVERGTAEGDSIALTDGQPCPSNGVRGKGGKEGIKGTT